jgi:branched-chain amino acid transport system ATP-binding protein
MSVQTTEPNIETPAILRADQITAGYRHLVALDAVSLSVRPGEAAGIIGHNGAGKTTLLKVLFGQIRPMSGTVAYAGVIRDHADCRDSIRRGMAFVPADRYTFPTLTVRENLQIAALNADSSSATAKAERTMDELFPIVGRRLNQVASTLSGGERRMLGISMALMWDPRLLLLDEPSLGLAPAVSERVFEVISMLVATEGLSVLCVEQSIPQLLSLVSRVYVLREGRMQRELTAEELRQESDLWQYF